MEYEVFEFEPGRWSYKVDGTPSGETFPSRSAALIAAEQARDRQAQVGAAGAGHSSSDEANGDLDKPSGDIEGLDKERSGDPLEKQ